MLKKLLRNRKGTAEVIGSVMFIVILLFFFTNVYLWHDAATKQMNDMYVKKMNAGMTPNFDSYPYTITAQGSGVVLSRIWVVTSTNQHLYADLERGGNVVNLMAGQEFSIEIVPTTVAPSNEPVEINWVLDGRTIKIYCPSTINRISVLNTLGIIV
jgi:hypothetical protein